MQPQGSHEDWLYVIQAGESGPVKIGRSRDPQQRLRELQTGHHETLRIVATVRRAALERHLHARFTDLRLRGEWFDGSILDDVLDFIIGGSAERRAEVAQQIERSLGG